MDAVSDAPAPQDSVWPGEAGQQPGVGGDRQAVRFPRLQLYPLEPQQAKTLLATRPGQIQLRDIGPGVAACVGHLEARGDRLACADFKVAVREARVAEPIPEGVARGQALAGKPSVSNLSTFVVADGRGRAPRR